MHLIINLILWFYYDKIFRLWIGRAIAIGINDKASLKFISNKTSLDKFNKESKNKIYGSLKLS